MAVLRLSDIIDQIREVPALPDVAFQVLNQLEDPDARTNEISRLITRDAGLSGSILKTVNSAAFGLARSVDTVGHGLAMMGRGRLESLVLGLAVRDALPTPTTES